jgi:hypothetical protein
MRNYIPRTKEAEKEKFSDKNPGAMTQRSFKT